MRNRRPGSPCGAPARAVPARYSAPCPASRPQSFVNAARGAGPNATCDPPGRRRRRARRRLKSAGDRRSALELARALSILRDLRAGRSGPRCPRTGAESGDFPSHLGHVPVVAIVTRGHEGPAAERWPSGLRRTPGTRVYGKPYRGFESLSLRHFRRFSSYNAIVPPSVGCQSPRQQSLRRRGPTSWQQFSAAASNTPVQR